MNAIAILELIARLQEENMLLREKIAALQAKEKESK